MALHPTAELVAKAFISGIPGVPSGKVATALPAKREAWPDGFVVAVALPSTPQLHVKKRESILDVVCWYPPKPGSNKPQWNHAAQLAEDIFDEAYRDPLEVQRLLTALPSEYNHARVLSWMPGEPERRGNDSAGNAAFGLNIEMHWIAVPK